MKSFIFIEIIFRLESEKEDIRLVSTLYPSCSVVNKEMILRSICWIFEKKRMKMANH